MKVELELDKDIIEMIEEELNTFGSDIDEMMVLYNNAGGDKMYEWWCGIYGETIIDEWIESNRFKILSEVELIARGVAIGFASYIKWLKNVN